MTDQPQTNAMPLPAAAFVASRNGQCKLVPIVVTDFYRKEVAERTVKGAR